MEAVPGAVADVADLEVPEKPQRRRFTAEYKIRILREVEACTGPGDVGALLRREGLYTSHLSASPAALSPCRGGAR
jgi:transposase